MLVRADAEGPGGAGAACLQIAIQVVAGEDAEEEDGEEAARGEGGGLPSAAAGGAAAALVGAPGAPGHALVSVLVV
jgi:hypothetical protein